MGIVGLLDTTPQRSLQVISINSHTSQVRFWNPLLTFSSGLAQEDPCHLLLNDSRYRLEYGIWNKYQLDRIRNCTVSERSIILDDSHYAVDVASWKDNTTNINDTVLDLGDITRIMGNLHIISSRLSIKTLKAENLMQIGGALNISGLPFLEEITMPVLQRIGENVPPGNPIHFDWSDLPSLQRVQFSEGGVGVFFRKNDTAYLDIQRGVYIKRTGLQRIDFLKSDPNVPHDYYAPLDNLIIQDNPQLNEIDLPNLTTDLGFIDIRGNRPNSTVTLDKLPSAYNITITKVTAINLPRLWKAHSFELSGTTLVNVVLDKLGEIMYTLDIRDNPVLNTLVLKNLTRIGSDQRDGRNPHAWPYKGDIAIENNPVLRHISLDALEEVGGSVRINGPFTK